MHSKIQLHIEVGILINEYKIYPTNQRKDKKAMKKLLKKMAYDREKYEKQDKSANDVRNNLKIYVFMQIAVLFLISYIHQRVLNVL